MENDKMRIRFGMILAAAVISTAFAVRATEPATYDKAKVLYPF